VSSGIKESQVESSRLTSTTALELPNSELSITLRRMDILEGWSKISFTILAGEFLTKGFSIYQE
jgi:hypothetical protein